MNDQEIQSALDNKVRRADGHWEHDDPNHGWGRIGADKIRYLLYAYLGNDKAVSRALTLFTAIALIIAAVFYYSQGTAK
jgi:hypothetical protein